MRTARNSPSDRRRPILAILAFALTAACCAAPARSVAISAPEFAVVELDQSAAYVGLAWDGSSLVVARAEAPLGAEFRLVALDPVGGDKIAERARPAKNDCQRLDETAPVDSGGELYWVMDCLTPDAGVRRIDIVHAADILGMPTVVASVATRASIRHLDVRDAEVLTSYGSHICETLARLDATGLQAVSIEVRGSGGSFDTGFDPIEACDSNGITVLPTTNGQGALAFAASTAAIGLDGPKRLDTPFEVYVADRAREPVDPLGFQIFAPTALLWTPDDRWLIASGRASAPQVTGTWRIDPLTGDATQILPFGISAPTWSSDGTTLAALRRRASDAVGANDIVLVPATAFTGA